jgi:hypothetical protein
LPRVVTGRLVVVVVGVVGVVVLVVVVVVVMGGESLSLIVRTAEPGEPISAPVGLESESKTVLLPPLKWASMIGTETVCELTPGPKLTSCETAV